VNIVFFHSFLKLIYALHFGEAIYKLRHLFWMVLNEKINFKHYY
jgi:hypothetical protein